MAAWVDSASPVVRQDIEALLRVCADVAGQKVTRGDRDPFAVLMDHEGVVKVRSVFMPPGEDEDPWQAAAVMAQSIADHAAGLRAAIVVGDSGEPGATYLQGYGDHREGKGFDARVEWAFTTGGPAVVVAASLDLSTGKLFL